MEVVPLNFVFSWRLDVCGRPQVRQAKLALTTDPPASTSQQLGLQVDTTIHTQLVVSFDEFPIWGSWAFVAHAPDVFFLVFFFQVSLTSWNICFSLFSFRATNFILCMGDLPTCLYSACRGQRRALDPLELKLQKQAQGLWKSKQWPKLPSHLSIPCFKFLRQGLTL